MRKKRNNILGASYSQIVPNTGSSSVNWTITFSTTHSSASTVFTQEGGCTTTGLTVSPTSMSFNAIDTSISSYTVSYNGTVLSSNEYNVNSIGGSWIVVSKKGEITVGDNTGNTSRDATVIVALVSDISKTTTMSITQSGKTVATWRPSITINMLGEGESTNTMYSAVVVASYSIVDSQGVTGETGSVTLYISDDEGRNTPVFNTVEVPEDSTFEYGHYTPNTLCRCTASKCAFVGANANAATSLTASNKSVVYTLYGTC